MIDFKFEVGKFYKRRDGLKAECVKIDCVGVYKNIITYVHGTRQYAYHVEESGYLFDHTETTGSDIIGVWEEPKPKRLCYRNRNFGTLNILTDSELAEHQFHNSLERFPCVLDEA